MLLVYLAGVVAFAGGDGTASLVDDKWFVATIAFGWLALITVANIRGLGVGKWINNIGGIGSVVTVLLLVAAAAIARWQGVAATAGGGRGLDARHGQRPWRDVLRVHRHRAGLDDGRRDPAPGTRRAARHCHHRRIALVSYLLVTDALLALVPSRRARARFKGSCRRVSRGAECGRTPAGSSRRSRWSWRSPSAARRRPGSPAPRASRLWPASTARLPPALGRVHPRWGSPHVALITCAVLSAALTALSLTGSTVAEAYQVLLKATVVINLVPFVYMFLAL